MHVVRVFPINFKRNILFF